MEKPEQTHRIRCDHQHEIAIEEQFQTADLLIRSQNKFVSSFFKILRLIYIQHGYLLEKIMTKFIIRNEEIKGDPTSRRGGKSKFYYEATPIGKLNLQKIKKAHKQVWSGIQEISLENGN